MMEYRPLGQTGVQASAYCLGTAFLGSHVPVDESIRIVRRALDLGVNFVDTANTYGDRRFVSTAPGYPREYPLAEEVVGQALAGRRHEVILATKVCEPVGDGPNDRGLSRRHVFQQIEASLRRLGTDHVDLYYAHHSDPKTPIEETLRAFDDLVHQGKVRYAAISNFAGWQIVEALWTADRLGLNRPVCMQMNWNLLSRQAEVEQLPALARFGLGALAFASLAGGVLAARYRPGEAPPPGSRAEFWHDRSWNPARPSSTPARSEENLRRAQALAAWADERGHTASQVALAWLLGDPRLTAVISGASSVEQLEQSVRCVEIKLSQEEREEIGRLVA
jgi:aryl-alcohol dehydrogenase-like predicted oxidoreductase